jgi:hypothetical protein
VALGLQVTRTGILSLLVVSISTSACGTGGAQQAPRTTAREPLTGRAPAMTDRRQSFLVQTDAHALVLKSSSSTATHMLVTHADSALYQDTLELLWFLDGDRLSVLDLRKPDATAVVVARGSTEGRFMVHHGRQSIATEDGCDLPFIDLDWSAAPKIQPVLHDAPDLRIENGAWLQAEFQRPARSGGRSRDFSGDVHVPLPAKLLRCDDPESCGTALEFGAWPKRELVLVVDISGGDCFERACLLRDSSSGLYATPPDAKRWGDVEHTPNGPCGPYRFDEAQTSFLMGRWLCTLGPVDNVCKDVGGLALGWLMPGDSVGEPGVGNFRATQ